MAHERATAAAEEYLESLFWLYEAGLPMTGANLARAMQLSAPTVHEMLGRLERGGYVRRNAERMIEFTEQGREHAERLVGRHRMIERFLTDVVGVPWDDVHEEAEQLEHAMTPRFEAYVRSAVGEATRARTDIRSGSASGSTAFRWRTARRGRGSRSCASRTRPRTSCTTSRTRASSPGSRARWRPTTVSSFLSTAMDEPRRSPPASRRPSRCSPIHRHRRGSRSRSSSCWHASATGAERAPLERARRSRSDPPTARTTSAPRAGGCDPRGAPRARRAAASRMRAQRTPGCAFAPGQAAPAQAARARPAARR